MSTPERQSASHDLDEYRMGHLVSVDEFSSHTTHRPPQTPLHAYRDYSYAPEATRVRVTNKKPSAKEQKVPPAQKQRVSTATDTHYSIRYYDDDVEDTTTHSNQPTARMLTWKHKRVSSPGYLQVDNDQSLQTNAEQ